MILFFVGRRRSRNAEDKAKHEKHIERSIPWRPSEESGHGATARVHRNRRQQRYAPYNRSDRWELGIVESFCNSDRK
jgi:hypothetical protein